MSHTHKHTHTHTNSLLFPRLYRRNARHTPTTSRTLIFCSVSLSQQQLDYITCICQSAVSDLNSTQQQFFFFSKVKEKSITKKDDLFSKDTSLTTESGGLNAPARVDICAPFTSTIYYYGRWRWSSQCCKSWAAEAQEVECLRMGGLVVLFPDPIAASQNRC